LKAPWKVEALADPNISAIVREVKSEGRTKVAQ